MSAPKTRDEYVSVVRQGKGPTRFETFTIAKPLRRLEKQVLARTNACLNKTFTHSNSRTLERISKTYLAFVERVGKDRVQVTVRVKHTPSGIGSPEGGVFMFAADLSAKGKQTMVEVYSVTFPEEELTAAMRAWVQGEDAKCPDLG